MSSVVIAGNTSGSVTLAAPDVAGTTTLTLPATSGTVLTDASTTVVPKGTPAFSAYKSGGVQSVSSGTSTKVVINAERFDTNSNFDTSTYRFTPTVAGYYQFDFSMTVEDAATNYYINFYVYVGGVGQLQLVGGGGNGTSYYGATGSFLWYCQSSADYVELYCYASKTVNVALNQFSGALVRGA